MYRVMIVDDEQLIRITLKNMLDWKALDCSIIALAKDGEEAWTIYQQVRPEIVITDLKMPKVDGITLIQKIKQENVNTQVIVLSNHSDFDLVKDAMRAGALDYVLKVTLDEADLKRIIAQAKEQCVVDIHTKNFRYESVIEKLQQYFILCKNMHPIRNEDLQRMIKHEFFDPYREVYQLAYFRLDHIDLYYQEKSNPHEIIRRNLLDLITETIPNFLTSQIMFISNHSGVILFQGKEKLRVLNTCNSIMRNIRQYLDVQLSITISNVSHDVMDVFTMFGHVLECHEMRFYVGEGVLIEAAELATFNRLQISDIDFHSRILETVSSRNFANTEPILQDFMMYMKQAFIRPCDVLDYVVFILNNIEGNELAKGIKVGFQFQDMVKMIHQCETIDKLNDVLQQMMKRIEGWLMDETSNRYRKDITDIIAYIEENYKTKITLKMISETFNINESYLSRMFKSETGKNLIYFINEHKMRKARELLCDPKVMVKEAAYAVGIEDQFYFNKVFKKFYDLSPSEFRKRMSGKEEEIPS